MPIEDTEQIITQFHDTDNQVDLKVAKQQLEWMQEQNKNRTGISSFVAYFFGGYNKRLMNSKLTVANNIETEQEDLPTIPMFNWLNNE